MAGITLDRNGTMVTLEDDLAVARQVGRPEADLRSKPSELPNYIDKRRSASDVFELSGEFLSDAAAEDARTLAEDILRPPLGRGSLTLAFDGLLGLGTYSVFPAGSRAGRVSYSAGETGVVRVDTLELRVVNNS